MVAVVTTPSAGSTADPKFLSVNQKFACGREPEPRLSKQSRRTGLKPAFLATDVNGSALANSSRWFTATIWQGEHRAS